MLEEAGTLQAGVYTFTKASITSCQHTVRFYYTSHCLSITFVSTNGKMVRILILAMYWLIFSTCLVG